MNRVTVLLLVCGLTACGTAETPNTPSVNEDPSARPAAAGNADQMIPSAGLGGTPEGVGDPSSPSPAPSPSPSPSPEATPAADEDDPVTEVAGDADLTVEEILVRASVDVRGRRPSFEEFERLAADSTRLDTMLEGFLEDDGFADSVADLFARTLRSRVEDYLSIPEEQETTLRYQVAVGAEPLMLLRHIVREDLSYDEFITADYTFANEELAATFPVEGYDDARGGWQRVRYRDDRPAAGYIAMGSTYMRYMSDEFNYNRGRANALSRILVCDDFLKRPIDFPRDIDLSDENAIANAVSANPVCTGCHDQLDPIASFLFPFTPPEDGEYDAGFRSENADEWEEATGKAPAYYGRSGEDIGDLARLFLADPRYGRCAVTRVYEGLLDRPGAAPDSAAIDRHLAAFEAGGRTFKALYRSIMADPVYRGRVDGDRGALGAKMLSPELLQRVVTDLTGFHAKTEGVDLLRLQDGLRILGGGLSAYSGEYPSRTANVTRALVQARVAEAAATAAVFSDSVEAERLFGPHDREARVLTDAALEHLHRAVLSRAPTAEERSGLTALFDGLREDGLDAEMALAGVLSVLIRDPEFVIY